MEQLIRNFINNRLKRLEEANLDVSETKKFLDELDSTSTTSKRETIKILRSLVEEEISSVRNDEYFVLLNYLDRITEYLDAEKG